MDNDNTVAKYDRVRGGLEGVALFTKPSTVKNVQIITGKTETFVVETARHEELGDTIFNAGAMRPRLLRRHVRMLVSCQGS